jgi:hypothetical protein
MPVKAFNTTTRKGITRTPPTEGSKTQKRKANLAEHKRNCHRN